MACHSSECSRLAISEIVEQLRVLSGRLDELERKATRYSVKQQVSPAQDSTVGGTSGETGVITCLSMAERPCCYRDTGDVDDAERKAFEGCGGMVTQCNSSDCIMSGCIRPQDRLKGGEAKDGEAQQTGLSNVSRVRGGQEAGEVSLLASAEQCVGKRGSEVAMDDEHGSDWMQGKSMVDTYNSRQSGDSCADVNASEASKVGKCVDREDGVLDKSEDCGNGELSETVQVETDWNGICTTWRRGRESSFTKFTSLASKEGVENKHSKTSMQANASNESIAVSSIQELFSCKDNNVETVQTKWVNREMERMKDEVERLSLMKMLLVQELDGMKDDLASMCSGLDETEARIQKVCNDFREYSESVEARQRKRADVDARAWWWKWWVRPG